MILNLFILKFDKVGTKIMETLMPTKTGVGEHCGMSGRSDGDDRFSEVD